MTDKLESCPFCGGKPYINSHPIAQRKKQWAVQCRCGARFFFCDRKYKAIEAWNTRKPIDKVVEQLEKVSFVDVDEEYADDGQIILFLHDAIEIVKGGSE